MSLMRKIQIYGPHGVIFQTTARIGKVTEPFPNHFEVLDPDDMDIVSGFLTTANLIITPCPVVANSDEGEG